jgi:hypothetical protein
MGRPGQGGPSMAPGQGRRGGSVVVLSSDVSESSSRVVVGVVVVRVIHRVASSSSRRRYQESSMCPARRRPVVRVRLVSSESSLSSEPHVVSGVVRIDTSVVRAVVRVSCRRHRRRSAARSAGRRACRHGEHLVVGRHLDGGMSSALELAARTAVVPPAASRPAITSMAGRKRCRMVCSLSRGTRWSRRVSGVIMRPADEVALRRPENVLMVPGARPVRCPRTAVGRGRAS